MRNAVLHEGTSLSDNFKTTQAAKQTRYRCFSFVDPESFSAPIHQTANDADDIFNIDVAELANDTRQAMQTWFDRLQHDALRMAAVERNLPKLVRAKPKVAPVDAMDAKGNVVTIEYRGFTTSSS